MKVLVTGASGFVGGHIVDQCLAQGDSVRVLARPSSDLGHLTGDPRVERASGDLHDPDALRRAADGVDVVYHSAARVLDYGTRAEFYETNVAGTQRLLDAARAGGASRFVFVSSPSVVAEDADQIGIDESYPYPARPMNLYCETKAEAERAVLGANGGGLVTCAIRPRGVWGPRDRAGFLPKMLSKLVAGRFPDISDGKKVYASLCYCENAAEACLLAAKSDRVGGKAYFVTDAEPIEVWSFIAEMSARVGAPKMKRKISQATLRRVVSAVDLVWRMPWLAARRSPPVSHYAIGMLTRSSTYDIGAAARDFGYRPRVDREEGLRRLFAWIDDIGGLDEFFRHVR